MEQIGIDEAGPPLGFDPASQFAASVVTLEAGDSVVMYTDGISEATNADEQVYGIKRVCKSVADGPKDIELLGQLLLDDVDRFVAGQAQTDDICLLAFGRPRSGK